MRFQYINRQIVAGFVGNEVVLRYMPSGDAVLELSVATTHSWKDKQDKWHDDTEWHTCILYRKQASEAAELLTQGSAVYAEGRSYTRSWEAQDGSKRKRKEIIVDKFYVINHVRSEKEGSAAPARSNEGGNDEPPVNMAGFDEA